MRRTLRFSPLLLSVLVLAATTDGPVTAAIEQLSEQLGGDDLTITALAIAEAQGTVPLASCAHPPLAVEDLETGGERRLARVTTRPAVEAVPRSAEPEPERRCCFNNRSFHGTCVVEIGPEETCQSVLDYLNNPRSAGRTYCGNTNIRGGWKQVPCEPAR